MKTDPAESQKNGNAASGTLTSEVLMLKWDDIIWDQKIMMVPSPKTERYQGKEHRRIPFFPHIEECLIDAAEQAPKGAVYVVEKHVPVYLRGQKERVYISRQGNIGTMFRKIIHRSGIVPWEKLIHNLRASFETDLLNGKYGQFGLHTIADWLGHSVKVMLQHYGRIQQSDFDQIAAACEQVKHRKAPKLAHSSHTFLSVQEGITLETTVSNLPEGESPKAAPHLMARGGIEGHDGEMNQSYIFTQPLENKAHEGNKRHSEAHSVNCLNSCNRMERDSNPRYVSARRFSRPVP